MLEEQDRICLDRTAVRLQAPVDHGPRCLSPKLDRRQLQSWSRSQARIDAQYGIYLGDNFNLRQLMLRAVHPQVLELPYNTREEDLRGLPDEPLSRSAKKLRLRKKQGQKRKFSAS